MFIAPDGRTNELRQEFHVPLITSLHFTPDGVSGLRNDITINIALLTESSHPFSVSGISEFFHIFCRGGITSF